MSEYIVFAIGVSTSGKQVLTTVNGLHTPVECPLGLWLGVVAIPVTLLYTHTHSYGVLTVSCCHSAHGTCTLCKQNGGHDECVVPITIIPLLGLVVSFVPNSKTGIRICQCNHRHYMGQYSTCIYCAALDSCFSPCVGPHQCSV